MVFESGVCLFAGGRGNERFPLAGGPPLTLLASIFYERHTGGGVRSDTLRVKSCDTGSSLQATLRLQMSGRRVIHAGGGVCCVTPPEKLSPAQLTFPHADL